MGLKRVKSLIPEVNCVIYWISCSFLVTTHSCATLLSPKLHSIPYNTVHHWNSAFNYSWSVKADSMQNLFGDILVMLVWNSHWILKHNAIFVIGNALISNATYQAYMCVRACIYYYIVSSFMELCLKIHFLSRKSPPPHPPPPQKKRKKKEELCELHSTNT